MSKVQTLLQQISELKEALVFDNAQLEESIIDKIEHLSDMRSFGGEGYRLLQQKDNMPDELISHKTKPVQVAPHTGDAIQDITPQSFNHFDVFDVDEEKGVVIII